MGHRLTPHEREGPGLDSGPYLTAAYNGRHLQAERPATEGLGGLKTGTPLIVFLSFAWQGRNEMSCDVSVGGVRGCGAGSGVDLALMLG